MNKQISNIDFENSDIDYGNKNAVSLCKVYVNKYSEKIKKILTFENVSLASAAFGIISMGSQALFDKNDIHKTENNNTTSAYTYNKNSIDAPENIFGLFTNDGSLILNIANINTYSDTYHLDKDIFKSFIIQNEIGGKVVYDYLSENSGSVNNKFTHRQINEQFGLYYSLKELIKIQNSDSQDIHTSARIYENTMMIFNEIMRWRLHDVENSNIDRYKTIIDSGKDIYPKVFGILFDGNSLEDLSEKIVNNKKYFNGDELENFLLSLKFFIKSQIGISDNDFMNIDNEVEKFSQNVNIYKIEAT